MTKVKRVARPEEAGREPPSESARSKALSKVARSIEGFQLWSDVKPPLFLRTRLTSFNRALKSGGIPGGMIGSIHGKSQGGKTLLLAEILHAVRASGGWGLFVDAECRAVDLRWFQAICGRLDQIFYFKPTTYEDCVEKVQEFRNKFREAKDAGELAPEAFCGIGIDCINRLTPSTELEELLKGQVSSRGYPLRAMLNARWLDKLLPTLQRDETFVLIQRESTKIDAMPGQKTYTVKGGRAIEYDSGWICQVNAATRVKVRDAKDGPLCGEKHEIIVEKNSMGPHLEEKAWFYSATGKEPDVPCGLDHAREVREELLSRGVVTAESSGRHLLNGEVISASKPKFTEWLRQVGEDGRPRFEALREELNAKSVEE